MSLRTHLVFAGLALVLGGAGAAALQHRAASLAEAAREAEQRALRAEGLLAAEQASRARLEREAADLREQLAKVRKVAPRARVREVTRWKTREFDVPCPPAQLPSSHSPTTSSERSSTGTAVRLRIEGVDARVETRAGTRVALGEVEVWRVTPPPEQLVARLPWEATLHLVDEDLRPRARWAAGPAVGLVSGEWAYGAAVAGPPLRVGRLEARPLALGLAGGGEWTLVGALLVSW